MSMGMSLHLGLNRVSIEHYGSEKPLRGCHNDARDMSRIASGEGYSSTVMLDEQATAEAVLRHLHDAAIKLTAGDAFVLSFAGHGSQVTDRDGDDEDDGRDETWLLFDRMLIDDEINTALAEFQPGVRVLVVSDSCHSGTLVGRFARLVAAVMNGVASLFGRKTTVFRTPSRGDFGASIWRRHEKLYQQLTANLPEDPQSRIRAAVIQLSACKDDQLAADGDTNGLFTRQLKKVWNDGGFTGTHREFLDRISERMSDVQTPSYVAVGSDTAGFERQRPFTVSAPIEAGENPEPAPGFLAFARTEAQRTWGT